MHLNTFSFWRGPRWWCVLGILDAASASQHRILLQRATMSGRSMLQAAFGKDPPNRHSHYIVVVVVFFVPKTISNDCFFFFFFSSFLCVVGQPAGGGYLHTPGKEREKIQLMTFGANYSRGKWASANCQQPDALTLSEAFFSSSSRLAGRNGKLQVLKKLQIDSIRMWNKSNLARLKTFAKTRKR